MPKFESIKHNMKILNNNTIKINEKVDKLDVEQNSKLSALKLETINRIEAIRKELKAEFSLIVSNKNDSTSNQMNHTIENQMQNMGNYGYVSNENKTLTQLITVPAYSGNTQHQPNQYGFVGGFSQPNSGPHMNQACMTPQHYARQ